jgi:hypothetical protein
MSRNHSYSLPLAEASLPPNAAAALLTLVLLLLLCFLQQLLQRLADSREVIIFDNMRTGLSVDNSTQPLSIPLMANSTAALITKLGLNQPDIWR